MAVILPSQEQTERKFNFLVKTLLPSAAYGTEPLSNAERLLQGYQGPANKLVFGPPAKEQEKALKDKTGKVKTWAEMAADGSISSDAQKALDENQRARARAEVGKAHSGGFLGIHAPKSFGDFVSSLGHTALRGGVGALDLIQRPIYAVSGVEKAIVEGHPDLGTAFAKGIAGQEKTHGSDVLKTAGVNNKLLRSIGGFGMDVLQDPLSYVTFGTTGALSHGAEATAAKLAEQGVEEGFAKNMSERLISSAREVKAGPTRTLKPLKLAEVSSAAEKAAADEARQFVKSGGRAALRRNLIEQGLEGPALKAELENQLQRRTADLVAKATEAGKFTTKGQTMMRLGFLGRGSNVLPEAIGSKAWEALQMPGKLLDSFGAGKTLKNSFQFERYFPGLTQEIRRKVSNFLAGEHETFRREMNNVFRGTTREERELITDAIHNGRDLTGRGNLEELKQRAIGEYRKMFDDEAELGLRKPSDWVDNYTHQMYDVKGEEGRKALAEFKAKRKAAFKNELTTSANEVKGVGIQDAIDKGLKPDTDVLSNLLARKAKSYRDINRSWFRHETILQYGANYDKKLANPGERGLVEIPRNKLTPQLEATVKKNGAYYLPKEIYGAFDAMEKLQKINNADLAKPLWRMFDTANRWFKMSRTVFRPQYHVGNAVGDSFMAWLSGMTPADLARQGLTDLRAAKGVVTHNIAGHDIEESVLRDLFERHGASNAFYNTEIASQLKLRDNPLLNAGSVAVDKIRKFSELREDFIRRANFNGRLSDRFRQIVKEKGGGQLAGAELDNALNSAAKEAARVVDKFHVDFTALAPFEQEWARRFVPFYTYMRKAAPVMMQSIFTNPGRVSAIPKLLNAAAVGAGFEPGKSGLNQLMLPDYLKEPGQMVQLSGGKEPWLFTPGSMIPFYNLANPLGLGSGESGSKDWQSMVSRLNPALTFPFEMAAGKEFFTGKKITNPLELLKQKADPTDWLRKEIKTGKAGPLATIGISQLPIDRQVAAIKHDTEKYKAANAILNKRNREKGLEILTTRRKDGTTYRLVNRLTGEVIGEYPSAAAAQVVADKS